jgi:hypothetical protein
MSETITTPDLTTVVDDYLSMWNEPDGTCRADLIRRAWVDDGHYVDPLLEARRHHQLSEMVDGVQTQFPGHLFRRTSAVDTHHDVVRFGWELAAPDGSVTVAGVDVGVVAPDGRLQALAGFFGPLPEA